MRSRERSSFNGFGPMPMLDCQIIVYNSCNQKPDARADHQSRSQDSMLLKRNTVAGFPNSTRRYALKTRRASRMRKVYLRPAKVHT